MSSKWMIVGVLLCACTEKTSVTDQTPDSSPPTDAAHDAESVSLDATPDGATDATLDPAADQGVDGATDGAPLDAAPADAAPPIDPLDCADIDAHPDWQVCSTAPNRCTAVFTDGAGCTAVCRAAGMRCVESFEDVSGACAPDQSRPALGCADGHMSDYCVCHRGVCVPDCEDRACGADGCGGVCGACADDTICRNGVCVSPPDVLCRPDACPAFPGAEGEGRNARGGRGGDVCRVTRLSDDGEGSLRHCLTTADGPRTVVFAVAGYINLRSTLQVNASNLTIAGQTAPGDGITIRDWGVVINGDHLIIQHLRFRAGDREKATRDREGFTEDSLSVTGDDVMIDHVSASWGIDENLSCGPGPFRRITVQYSIIAEGLHRTRLFHGEYDADHPGHSMGGLYKSREGDSTISIHHNLFAHNNNRNPAIGNYDADDTFDADIRNNVIYSCRNMGYVSGASQRVRVNYLGNYGVFGPASRSDDLFRGNEDSNVQIYQQGNLLDAFPDGRVSGLDGGWRMFGDDYSRLDAPVNLAPVITETAEEALRTVLDRAGARPWSRDRADVRIVRDVEAGTGGLIDSQSDVDGWGPLDPGDAPLDTDRDGMPDAWEARHGSDPQGRDHNADADGDGYTNLENYLHWAARIDGRD